MQADDYLEALKRIKAEVQELSEIDYLAWKAFSGVITFYPDLPHLS
jgi:hypothetical protein